MSSDYGSSLSADEGREFLKLITDVDWGQIDKQADWQIESWLAELGYEWRGLSWVPTGAER